METAKMFFWLTRISPRYIRYLKTQAVHNVERRGEMLTPRVAILLGATGIGVSGYSSRQLTLHHKPYARVLH